MTTMQPNLGQPGPAQLPIVRRKNKYRKQKKKPLIRDIINKTKDDATARTNSEVTAKEVLSLTIQHLIGKDKSTLLGGSGDANNNSGAGQAV
jgi:hypothetical protein